MVAPTLFIQNGFNLTMGDYSQNPPPDDYLLSFFGSHYSQRKSQAGPVTSTSSGSACVYSLPIEEPTIALPFDMEMLKLERAARLGDTVQFAQLVNQMDWQYRSVDDYLHTVQLALSIGAHLTARKLAIMGGECFPDNPDMAKHARILAPVKTIRSDLPAKPDIAKNMYWLIEHREEYRGRWVALKDGKLLASARAFQDLKQQVGPLKYSDILVTRVY